jgi:hypothetical protein
MSDQPSALSQRRAAPTFRVGARAPAARTTQANATLTDQLLKTQGRNYEQLTK